jgi:L-ascorbate metabolism protein UlaG (beta-lactamase superfamily)
MKEGMSMNQMAVFLGFSLALAVAGVCAAGAAFANAPAAGRAFEEDVFATSAGELTITFLGHGTLMLSFGGKVIHVDPYGKAADYSTLPKADAVLITHEHQDHLDRAALDRIVTPSTETILTPKCAGILGWGTVMKNGDAASVLGIPVRAVPAYNIVHRRDTGQPFHPKGEGNGYVLTFGDTTVYIAGDTENTPEMKALSGITVAFLPMNLPYTMSPEMVADAALAFRPKILYPYHYGQTDTGRLEALLKGSGIEVRIRKME